MEPMPLHALCSRMYGHKRTIGVGDTRKAVHCQPPAVWKLKCPRGCLEHAVSSRLPGGGHVHIPVRHATWRLSTAAAGKAPAATADLLRLPHAA